MWWMSAEDYAQLVGGGSPMEQDGWGVKVWRLPDRRIVKLFRVKRWLSLSAVFPYSLRFRRNAERLRQLEIPTVKVEQVFFCPHIVRHGVVYSMLEGIPLERLLKAGRCDPDLWGGFAEFVAELHRKGVLFRSLHFGNVLQMPDGRFGLIDIADIRFRRRALSNAERVRNFRHMLRRREQCEFFLRECFPSFLDRYGEATGWRPTTVGIPK
jgi:hypothetical protein